MSKQQTGRTTRMVEEAIRTAAASPTEIFYIVMPTLDMGRELRKRRMAGAPPNLGTVGANEPRVAEINFTESRIAFEGGLGTSTAFIDHSVAEQAAEGMLKAAARWDAKPGEYGYADDDAAPHPDDF